jgi:hypothetical protein
MLAKSIHDYYWFGTCVRYLQDAQDNYPLHLPSGVLTNLRRFFTYLDELGLQVTKRAAWDLAKLTEELESTSKDSNLGEDQAKRMRKIVDLLRSTLEAELEGFVAFVVTPKRIETSKLLNGVDSLFNPELFGHLPEIAIHDFTEAGKCIAFERATAAAFQMPRGTEAVLRHYYCRIISRDRVDLMWGPMVIDLRKQGNATLHNNLDNIRHSYRNPTQHPEKVYDIQEVQDLWGLCVDVVNKMMRELHPKVASKSGKAKGN